MYIQRHGRVPEVTAKYFMQQLATGLQVLRDNNLIHRDLKPQNLLLTSFDENSVLKIADFGFARSLQPRGLAETLCGSPLYMAPEIMQLQKYDAKADLWSVGAILFQLVTGRTPFTGINQIQLLQNIIKSNELRFPPDNNLSYDCIDLCQKLLRRNPVERLTFEEFFNHQFLYQQQPEESLSRTSSDMRDALAESSPARPSGESSQEDCLPFLLDDEPSGHEGVSSGSKNRASVRSTYGFSLDNKADKSPVSSPSRNVGVASRFSSSPKKLESTSYGRDSHRSGGTFFKETAAPRKDSAIADSLEFVDQEYVLVPGPPLEMSSSSVSALGTRNSPGKLDGTPLASRKSSLSAPVPITGAAISDRHAFGSVENRCSPASGTSQGSMDAVDTIEQPSAHCMTRIRSLQQCASVVTELVREEVANGRRLEAFSIQLVILAIWKQALHICHTQAASAIEGSPSQEVGGGTKFVPNSRESYSSSDSPLPDALCSQIERDFLVEVGHAEELARDMGQVDETTEMPDAIEIVFQSALTLGRHGAVDEMMGNTERAAARYSKSICLLRFLLVEASSLVLNPPVSLTKSDRYRLRSYIDIIGNRQGQSQSQRVALLKCEDH